MKNAARAILTALKSGRFVYLIPLLELKNRHLA